MTQEQAAGWDEDNANGTGVEDKKTITSAHYMHTCYRGRTSRERKQRARRRVCTVMENSNGRGSRTSGLGYTVKARRDGVRGR